MSGTEMTLFLVVVKDYDLAEKYFVGNSKMSI